MSQGPRDRSGEAAGKHPGKGGRPVQVKAEVFEHSKAKSQVGEVCGGHRTPRRKEGRTPGVEGFGYLDLTVSRDFTKRREGTQKRC